MPGLRAWLGKVEELRERCPDGFTSRDVQAALGCCRATAQDRLRAACDRGELVCLGIRQTRDPMGILRGRLYVYQQAKPARKAARKAGAR